MRTDASFARASLDTVSGKAVVYRLSALEKEGLASGLDRLPFSIKVLLEAVLRNVRRRARDVEDDVERLATWNAKAPQQTSSCPSCPRA